jgi:hypothetical protein
VQNILFVLLWAILTFNISDAIPSNFLSNPAFYNLPNDPNYRLRYLLIEASAFNNTFNLSQYYKNFSKDIEWDVVQKNIIFNLITETGFKLNTDVIYTPVEFSSRWLNGSFQYRQLTAAYAPEDLFELALFGNDLNRYYDISNFKYDRLKYYDVAVGFSYPVINYLDDEYETNYLSLKLLNLGFKFHWLRGTTITQTDSSFGSVYTTPDIFLGELKLFQSTAQGGDNFSVDLGAITQLQPPITLGVGILNLNTGFVWNKQPQKKVLQIKINSFSLQRYIETGSIDSFYHKKDSIVFNSSFKTSLPSQILVQASYPFFQSMDETNQPVDIVTLTACYRQYLSDNQLIMDFNRSLMFNFGLSLPRFLIAELSFTTNFKKEFIVGHSICFYIKGFNANLAIFQRNGYWNKAKGIGLKFYLGQNW